MKTRRRCRSSVRVHLVRLRANGERRPGREFLRFMGAQEPPYLVLLGLIVPFDLPPECRITG